MPLVNVKIHGFIALAVQTVPVSVCNDGINQKCRFIGQVKVQGGDIHRDGDPDVVGIDPRLAGLLPGIADGLGASREQQKRHTNG